VNSLICLKINLSDLLFFDTHAHWDDAFAKDHLATEVARAQAAGLTQVAIPNCDVETLPNVLAAYKAYPDFIRPMCGLHPTYVKADVEEQLQVLKNALFAEGAPFVAVGEVGLDLYWRKDNLAEQQRVLETQLQWAADLKLPVALHSRDAFYECLEVVESFRGKISGVFHCFSGSVSEAEKVKELGFFIGIGGNITYKNNPTITTLHTVGLGFVVLETDSPYLAPVPFRGKPNQPAYTRHVAEFLAVQLTLPLAEVAQLTTRNAYTLFKLST
jgi:TatD DNase family protein